MKKYDFINIKEAKFGDAIDSVSISFGRAGIIFKEVNNANKRIRHLIIQYPDFDFNEVRYNPIQLDFLDGLLFSIRLTKLPLESESEFKKQIQKTESIFGSCSLKIEKEQYVEYFYTDTFVSCIIKRFNYISGDNPVVKGFSIRYFDNISELSQERTQSNPAVVSLIKENFLLLKKKRVSAH